MKIAVIDSGIGGLTVTEAIKKVLPMETFIYCSDNAHFPYGEKTAAEVLAHTLGTAARVVQKYHPDLLVVACSTASTIALDALRVRYAFPIVGVVPAIKPAAELSESKVIGLLATNGTINRPYTDELITKFASDCQVVRFGSSKLVEMAEAKMAGENISLTDLKREVSNFLDTPKMDTVVLGCTHFPVLKEELEQVTQKKMRWLEPGEAIARRVLEVSKNFARNEHQTESYFCFTKKTDEITVKAARVIPLLGFSKSVLLY